MKPQIAKSLGLTRLLNDQNDYQCGVGQTVFAIVLPLRYLEGANLQDEYSLTKHLPILQTASFSIALKERCKQDYVTVGRILYSCNAGKVGAPKLRQLSYPHYGYRQAALVKMFLIQIETRLERYGITGCSHYRS